MTVTETHRRVWFCDTHTDGDDGEPYIIAFEPTPILRDTIMAAHGELARLKEKYHHYRSVVIDPSELDSLISLLTWDEGDRLGLTPQIEELITDEKGVLKQMTAEGNDSMWPRDVQMSLPNHSDGFTLFVHHHGFFIRCYRHTANAMYSTQIITYEELAKWSQSVP